MIDDLLDLTRIATGKIELRLARLDAHDVVREALEIGRAATLSLALNRDGAAMQIDKTFCNRQTQAESTELPRGPNVRPAGKLEKECAAVRALSNTGVRRSEAFDKI